MIDVLKRKGKTIDEIASKLKRHKSTICREFKRNSSSEYGCYLASRANERAFKRRRSELPVENGFAILKLGLM